MTHRCYEVIVDGSGKERFVNGRLFAWDVECFHFHYSQHEFTRQGLGPMRPPGLSLINLRALGLSLIFPTSLANIAKLLP